MSLKVFDLQCEHGHLFEGWFGSHEDYDSQQARGLVACPVCNSVSVSKRLSAPRLNVGHYKETANAQAPSDDGGRAGPVVAGKAGAQIAQLQAAFMQRMREIVRGAENVGPRFAEEARRIHEGESESRPIRGTATRDEREALAADGIAVMALPDILDDDRLQ